MGRSDDRASDEALLARGLAGDRAAWDAFVARFAPLVYGTIHDALARYHVPADSPRVDDLFGGAFLALWDRDGRKLRQWSGHCSLASWIRLVTTSVVVDDLRRRRPEVSLDADHGSAGPTLERLADPAPHAHDLLERAERIGLVRAALDRMSDRDRALLLRLFADGVKPGRVAEEMGLRPGAVYTRKNRALARLREAVEDLAREGGGL
ncbi:MAG: RNA polymerase sigma factor [Myxococcota bacterium]